ncbi:NAD(P)/FAD-dependent oxidoreductase, partial [Candidatus Woesearchaeota archaeon]|nr:NAD(P)/FAD-dependent oxidoreductase [Candidatus Woesearchaeota archaeon]
VMMITVIGGGPTGSFLAQLLAKSGYKVVVLEEDKQIGTPVQCTGIVTGTLQELVDVEPGVILNRVTMVKLHSPNRSLPLKLNEPNLVLDRKRLDIALAEEARKAGAIYKLNTRVLSVERGSRLYMIKTNRGDFKAKIVIGADGPRSTTAKHLGLYRNRVLLKGKQIVVRKSNNNCVEFFLMRGYFGWLVPVNRRVVRAGVATLNNPNKSFELFSKVVGVAQRKPLETQGGLIPIFEYFGRRSSGNAYLVGDAGGFVKATTGGGLVQGLSSAKLCHQAITHGSSYELLWRANLGWELLAHKAIFDTLKRLSNKQLDTLLTLLSKPDVKHLLESQTRDKLLKWGFKLVAHQPRFIPFFIAALLS